MKKNSKKPDIEEAQKTQQEGAINGTPTGEDHGAQEGEINRAPTEDRSESEDAIHRVPTKKQEPRQRRRKKEEGEINRAPTDEDHGEIDIRSLRRQGSQRNEDEEGLSIPYVWPVLPLKDTVVYPFALQPLGVGQERSIRLIDDVMRGNRLVALVAQKSADIEQAGPDDIFRIGTVARIARMIRMPDGTIQIIVQGLERVEIGEFVQEKPYLTAHVQVKPEKQETDDETEAIKRNVISYFQRLVTLVQNVREEVASATLNMEEARQVAFVIATFVQMDLDMRQKILELDSVRAKLQTL